MNEKRKGLRKVASILIILAIVVAMPVAQAHAALEVMRRPIVYVKDANSHVTIQGASIDMDGVSVGTTDSSGALVIVGAHTGSHQLSVRKGGYLTYQTTIVIGPSNNTLTAYLTSALYSTDFEDVTITNQILNNMGILAGFTLAGFTFGSKGGADSWMEGLDRTSGPTPHSGTRCVGMELTDITKSRRNEFNLLMDPSWDRVFVSEWLLLPSGWKLHTSNAWYLLAAPFGTEGLPYLPYAAIHIGQSDPNVEDFFLTLEIKDINGVNHNYGVIWHYPLPRGRWFNLQFYLYRHLTDGIVKVWIDGQLLFDAENVTTKHPTILSWYTSLARIYYDESDIFSPYRIWVDDLEIYNTEP
jgi:hypothetical protein